MDIIKPFAPILRVILKNNMIFFFFIQGLDTLMAAKCIFISDNEYVVFCVIILNPEKLKC